MTGPLILRLQLLDLRESPWLLSGVPRLPKDIPWQWEDHTSPGDLSAHILSPGPVWEYILGFLTISDSPTHHSPVSSFKFSSMENKKTKPEYCLRGLSILYSDQTQQIFSQESTKLHKEPWGTWKALLACLWGTTLYESKVIRASMVLYTYNRALSRPRQQGGGQV